MNDSIAALGAVTEQELTSQPEIWTQALALPAEQLGLLPQRARRCSSSAAARPTTSGDAYAYLRNDAGLGRTRAAIPTELTWVDDDEHIVVISRSGTTADVVEVVERYQRHAPDHRDPRRHRHAARRAVRPHRAPRLRR